LQFRRIPEGLPHRRRHRQNRSGAKGLHQEHNFAGFYSAMLDKQFG
jgi:hypothetical protein